MNMIQWVCFEYEQRTITGSFECVYFKSGFKESTWMFGKKL